MSDLADYRRALTLEKNVKKERIDGKCDGLMFPQGRVAAHPAGPILLKYVRHGCPVDVGWNWSRVEIMAAVERGPHISTLAPEAIAMIHEEVEAKVKGLLLSSI